MLMFVKHRSESRELIMLRILNPRMKLEEELLNYYHFLEKGFEGKKKFDVWLESLSCENLILNDLIFEINHSIFQIDSLLITPLTMYLFEVKNFEGNYYIEDRKWYISKNEVKNPLLQLERTETLFRKLLRQIGYPQATYVPYVMFINPEFSLFHASQEHPIILPTQLNRLHRNINQCTRKLTPKHTDLSNRLLSKSLAESPFNRIPKYVYEELEKGIICSNCQSMLNHVKGRKLVCHTCFNSEDLDHAVLRTVREFELLFPNIPITTKGIFEWCGYSVSKRSIYRILNKHFVLINSTWKSHYIRQSTI